MNKAYLYAILAVLCWSTVATAFKLTLAHIEPQLLVFWAVLVSFMIYAFAIVVRGQVKVITGWGWRQWRLSMMLGFLNPMFYYLILFTAYDRLPAQEASTLNYLWPIVLVLMSAVINKQKLTFKTLSAMALCFLGALIIANHGLTAITFSDGLGAALALFSTILWAGYWLINANDTEPNVPRQCANFAFGLLYMFIFLLLRSELELPSRPALIGAIYIGFFEMGVTFILWLSALKLADHPAKVGILIYVIPFISLFFIRFILEEQIYSTTLIGLCFIIAGIIWQKTDKNLTSQS